LLKWFRQEASSVTAPIVAELGDLAIAKPWARIGTRTPGVVGGYFVLVNRGSEPDRLVSAASPAADSVTIHAIRVVGAEIRVRPLPDGLAIPAGTTLELKPRGYHLQLTGLKQPPAVGADLAVTVVFQKAGRVDLTLRVEDSGLVGGDIINEEAHRGR
jgi:copper(I)-binding protein